MAFRSFEEVEHIELSRVQCYKTSITIATGDQKIQHLVSIHDSIQVYFPNLNTRIPSQVSSNAVLLWNRFDLLLLHSINDIDCDLISFLIGRVSDS